MPMPHRPHPDRPRSGGEPIAHGRTRRHLLCAASAAAAWVACPALADPRRALARMTDGPFYPPRAWREQQWSDWDADLTRVQRGARTLVAQGEHLGLEGAVVDSAGRTIDGAVVEIWQCDAMAHYRHPATAGDGPVDEGFQGFGATTSSADGSYRFRTIKPVPYPGRTPHIHVKLRHASFGELTSQLFIAGDPGNARDGLWRWLNPQDRPALEMQLQPAPAGSELRWLVRHALVVPA